MFGGRPCSPGCELTRTRTRVHVGIRGRYPRLERDVGERDKKWKEEGRQEEGQVKSRVN